MEQDAMLISFQSSDRRKSQNEIGKYVEHCSAPVLNAQNLVESEMAKFQEKLSRSLTVCQDKYESAKLQPNSNNNGMNDLESCVELSVQDSINMMPHLAGKLRAYLSITD
ncbi:hypothetical protein DH2020_039625 [Rehmannia glutinosa]|uniref:Uncharacterized protein n=1 Tax=Rehmannia glutinosa TaxID=99300 RepID=A0ABR0UWK4_REHGL